MADGEVLSKSYTTHGRLSRPKLEVLILTDAACRNLHYKELRSK